MKDNHSFTKVIARHCSDTYLIDGKDLGRQTLYYLLRNYKTKEHNGTARKAGRKVL